MKEKIILSQRLQELRKEKGISQKDLAEQLLPFIENKEKISTSAMCSWENGVKRPPYEVLVAFSDYYGVSTDYLLGRSSIQSGTKDVGNINLEDNMIKITEEQLKENFANKPVYLIFKESTIPSRWGIYNKENDYFCCAENVVVNKPTIEYYVIAIESLGNSVDLTKRLSLDEAKKCDRVWIEYENPNDELRIRFTGWYNVDVKSSIFVASNGFALTFDSIGIVYHVYKEIPCKF